MELSRKFKMHKATVSRLLLLMVRQGVLQKDPDGSFFPITEWKPQNKVIESLKLQHKSAIDLLEYLKWETALPKN